MGHDQIARRAVYSICAEYEQFRRSAGGIKLLPMANRFGLQIPIRMIDRTPYCFYFPVLTISSPDVLNIEVKAYSRNGMTCFMAGNPPILFSSNDPGRRCFHE
jgi:hypothetical protein